MGRTSVPGLSWARVGLSKYPAWLLHPKVVPGNRSQMTEEILVRVVSVLVGLVVIATTGVLLVPIVIRLLIIVALFVLAVLLIASGLYLMGIRWNWRRWRH